MGIVIVVLILVFFSATGTFFNVIILNNAENAGPWIATLICVIALSSVISYLVVLEQLNIKSLLIIVGIAGAIQLIITGMVEMPHYWEDDETYLRLYVAIFSQPVNCLIGYGVSKLVKDFIENKLNDKLSTIKNYLENQKNVLENVHNSIRNNKDMDELTERFLCLFIHLGYDQVYSAYVDKKMQKEKDLVQLIRTISDKSELKLKTEDRLLSVIEKEVNEQLKELKEKIEFWNKTKFTSKDYIMVSSELKKLGLSR